MAWLQAFRWPVSGALRVEGGKGLKHTLLDLLRGLYTYMTRPFI
jgi:hypothetical protein